jgi:DNA repair exonuclease SbcCD ATPase subunit
MIIIKELRWSNVFSYGSGNKLVFDKDPITQLIGKNGHGKSSIALILEEILFNKNSKNIKKSDILNRYSSEKQYFIELDLEKDNDNYTIKTVRGSAQTVKLLKNGQDISSHTATSTYKTIEEILGFDHKTFSQIVYQSHASSLEFLVSTDSVRKKFLIDLLDLEIYTKAGEVFKEAGIELNKTIAGYESKISTINSWLSKYENADLTPKTIKLVPELDSNISEQLNQTKQQLNSLTSTNKKINQNNKYIKELDSITKVDIPKKPTESLSDLSNNSAVYKKEIQLADQFIKKMRALDKTCPTCLSIIDELKVLQLIEEKQIEKETAEHKLTILNNTIKTLTDQYNVWKNAVEINDARNRLIELIDVDLSKTTLDKESLELQLAKLTSSIETTQEKIQKIQKENSLASSHNAKIETITKQLVEFNEELKTELEKLDILSKQMSVLNVLVKTFSTTGLIAYKIETLVKDLESLTNKYLVELSEGRFQITFSVNNKDKLNVIITDNGKDIDILALSSGERARVNVATLLAIRKLMQSLSKTRINLLILDETIETLDIEGKERLIEILLNEDSLNTFLISHGFTHPLLHKINVIKRKNISYIEE